MSLPLSNGAIVGIVFAAGLASGWLVNGWRLNAELARVNAAHAEAAATAADELAATTAKYRKKEKEWQDEYEKISRDGAARLQAQLAKNETLERDVSDGARRLRIATARPACPAAVPGAADAGSLDNGASVELDRDAGRAVFAIRAGMIKDREKLLACQALLAQGQRAAEQR